MKQRVLATLAATLLTTAALSAQPPSPAPPPQPPAAPGAVVPLYQVPVDAHTTREQLQEILRQYPPAVGEVLRRDHSLLSRADYIAPYPQLVAFIQQHPEVVRNPTFFFGNYDYYERREPMSPEVEALGVLLGGLGGFLGFGAFFAILVWLVRAVIQHRRWLRQSKVQSDIHTKLMDRMTTNDELLAYIQSPAGRRFLESAPIQQESDSPRMGAAPVGPIIWSMMAGIVLATVGVGFRFAANSVTNEAQQAFTVVGVILLALGAGFVVASVMAYLVSSRLGLFPVRAAAPDASSGNA
jgi:heme/copper-type cytochrome/quinol oxidase subunit 3